MKTMKRIFALALALIMCLGCVPAAFAAEANDCTIDESAKASLTIWKYDWTNAYKDDAWNEASFISTGWRESYVEEVLGEAVREGDANGNPDNPLGNGQNANGYALKGVEFTIVRVADIVTFSESINDQHPDYNLTQVLYGFHKEKAADLLAAIGLPNGTGRYTNADKGDNYWYYQSDVLNNALWTALDENATTVKDALEAYVAASSDAIVMDKTNENGKTIQRNLDLGLWLCVETKVPEMVTSTTDPFFVSLPMTTFNVEYDTFSKKYGLINSRANTTSFGSDSSYCLLASLEVLDDEGNFVRKADMFSKRTIRQKVIVSSVDTASEALALSLGEKARIDMDYMQELTGKTEQQLYEDLHGVIFLDPEQSFGSPKYLPADEYLSGNVRKKLATAKKAAEQNPDYAVNVQALVAVQPKDLPASDISVRLGATWLPADVTCWFSLAL